MGGGAAGLVAAHELAALGASVILVDENEELGGQYYKPRPPELAQRDGAHRPRGAYLVGAAQAAGARCLTGALVWGVGDDGRTLLIAKASGVAIEARSRAVVVATGAYERALPFPGWELPGVVTPGLALHQAACDRVTFGRRILVAGTGPFLLATAAALVDVGASVACVVEWNKPYRPSSALFGAAHASRLWEALRYRAVLARHHVPLLQGWRVVAARGQGRVSAVHIAPVATGPGRWVEVDALAAGHGFRPSSELVQLLGVKGSVDHLGDFLPTLDEAGRGRASKVCT